MTFAGRQIGLLFRKLCTKGDVGAVERYIEEAPKDIVTIADIDYAGSGLPANLLDVVTPQDRPDGKLLPLVLYMHGGGWTYGNKELVSGFCNRMAHEGYVVCNINYRLSPENVYPAQIIDVIKAFHWMLLHTAEYGGDTSRVFIGGDSAGAHLASLMTAFATNPDFARACGLPIEALPEHRIIGALLFCGCFQFVRGEEDSPWIPLPNIFVDTKDERTICRWENLTPIGHMTAQYPPCFLSTGQADPLHFQSRIMIRALERAEIPADVHIYRKDAYPRADHEFQLRGNDPAAVDCRNQLWQFMARICDESMEQESVCC